MKRKTRDKLLVFIIFLGVLSLILDNASIGGKPLDYVSNMLDFLIAFLFVFELFMRFTKNGNKRYFLKSNLIEIAVVATFITLFIAGKYYHFFIEQFAGHDTPVKIIVAVCVFDLLKVFARLKKVMFFLNSLTKHPPQTILFSFFTVIIIGTILLMMPIATQDYSRIGFINALFTSTSATCVTGLVVLDTATRFSDFGKSVIMCLIQVGGLGIMILAYFTAFIVGRKMTYQDNVAMSYMIDEEDTRRLKDGIKAIVLMTFSFELVGAGMLFPKFLGSQGSILSGIFYSVFHAISAFCNAGFSLFTDNLEQFKASPTVNFVIAGLIIAGGISFAVMANVFGHVRSKCEKKILRQSKKTENLKLNTKIVLSVTGILLLLGTLLVYKMEHQPSLLEYSMPTQYMMAFFQSVTLRTAGFNTMDISSLQSATYAFMIIFMFIGGASGSCAGGIKVNTVGVIWSFMKSIFNRRERVVLFKHSVSKDLVIQAFTVAFLGLGVVSIGAFILSLTENVEFTKIVFETTSAFGTVGLSTGITPELSWMGKVVVAAVMFIGRLGPITVIAALSQKVTNTAVHYPEARVNIG